MKLISFPRTRYQELVGLPGWEALQDVERYICRRMQAAGAEEVGLAPPGPETEEYLTFVYSLRAIRRARQLARRHGHFFNPIIWRTEL